MIVQAPEHVIANEKSLAKIGDDPKKRRKFVRKKPPPGMVLWWGQPTFDRLVAADPEPLKSSFGVSHAMLLNVISRPGDAFASMRHLLTDNHEDRPAQRRHIHRTIQIYRALPGRMAWSNASLEPGRVGQAASGSPLTFKKTSR